MRFYMAEFHAGTRQFITVEDGEPEPYPAFREIPEDDFREMRRQRNRAAKKDKKAHKA